MFVELDIAVADAVDEFVCQFRHHIARTVHEIVVDEPLANKFLGELALGLTLFELLLVAFCVEVAAAVRRVNLVDENHLAVALTEFIFGIHEDEAFLGCNFRSALEEGACVALHHFIVLSAYDALCDNLLLGDVLVVTFVGFGGWSDDRLGETFVLTHTFRQLHAAELTATVLILAPSRAGEVAADNHLYAETLSLQTYGDHGVGSCKLPVGDDVSGGIEEAGCNLVQHLSLEGDAFRQHYVEGGDAVSCDHHHDVVVDVIHVAYFTMIYAFLSGKTELSFC